MSRPYRDAASERMEATSVAKLVFGIFLPTVCA